MARPRFYRNDTEKGQPAGQGRKKKKKNVTDGHWTSFLSKLRRKRPAQRKTAKKKQNKTKKKCHGRTLDLVSVETTPENGEKKKISVDSTIENLCGRFHHRKRCQNCHVTDRRTNTICPCLPFFFLHSKPIPQKT
jgi:hypothetical protein